MTDDPDVRRRRMAERAARTDADPRLVGMLRALFEYHLEQLGDEQRVVDWLAGMTDRYAIREFEQLSVPQGF